MAASRIELKPIPCPVCERMFDPSLAPLAMPFCSRRCQQVDLGRWLGERYSVPAPRTDVEEADEGFVE